MTTNEEPPLPVPGSALARVGRASATTLAGLADVALALLGQPAGAATALAAFQQLFDSNVSEATNQFNAVVQHLRDRVHRLEQQLRAGQIETEELRRRLTSVHRTLLEAGRHPDRELREALGALAARVLVEDVKGIEFFEVSEILARMTSLDYAVLAAMPGV